jgi:formylglycine-generating enzyme required for sulfatase activity
MPPPAITLATTEPVREFISSGEADQQVSDDGTFRQLFLDVLAGKEPDADANHDGYVTGTELGLFLHQKMTNLTYNRQTPRYGKLNALGYDRGDFVFQVGKPDVPTTTAVPTSQPTSEAAQAWGAMQGTTSQLVLEDFIKRYGDSFYGTLARARLEELKTSQVAVVEPPDSAPGSTASSEKSQVAEVQPPDSAPGSTASSEKSQVDVAAPPILRAPQRLQNTQVAVVAPPSAPSAKPCGGAPVTVSLSSRRSPQPLSLSEECALKPKNVFKECDKCPEMVVIPAGVFTMGSPPGESDKHTWEHPQHQVTIGQSFATGKFEITVDEFGAFVEATKFKSEGLCNLNMWENGGQHKIYQDSSWRNPGFAQSGSHPVVCVSWTDAKAYVEWLSRLTAKPYRLLTESEWEYAARARSISQYFYGDDPQGKEICRYGNILDQTALKKLSSQGSPVWPYNYPDAIDDLVWQYAPCTDGYAYTAPAGSFLPNSFGLYDMLGNAAEWVEDCIHGNGYAGAPTDGSAWTPADHACQRIVRGGSWHYPRWDVRSANSSVEVIIRSNDLGFRVARTLSP